MSNQMKLQDQYPYDSALWGLENLYSTVGHDSFYINYSCVIAKDHTLTTGHTYMLIHHSKDGQVTTQLVRLVDVYCDNININLVLCNVYKDDRINIQLNVRNRNYQCPWMLLDESSLQAVMDKVADQLEVYDYCIGGKE